MPQPSSEGTDPAFDNPEDTGESRVGSTRFKIGWKLFATNKHNFNDAIFDNHHRKNGIMITHILGRIQYGIFTYNENAVSAQLISLT